MTSKTRGKGAGVAALVIGALSLRCVDVDGLLGSRVDADAGTADASPLDGTTMDSSPPTDAGTDAPLQDAGCRDGAVFCDDFDHGDAGAGWTAVELSPTASMTLFDAAFESSPYSLNGRLSPTDAGNLNAYLRQRFIGKPSRFTCAVSFRIEEVPPSGGITAMFMGVLFGQSWYGFGFDVDPSQTVFWAEGALPDGGNDYKRSVLPSLPVHQWIRVELATDSANASLSLNGVSASTLPLPALPSVSYEVIIGPDSDPSMSQPVSFLYDDFACFVVP